MSWRHILFMSHLSWRLNLFRYILTYCTFKDVLLSLYHHCQLISWREQHQQWLYVSIHHHSSQVFTEHSPACCPSFWPVTRYIDRLSPCGPAAAVVASLRPASKISAVERNRQHRAHRGTEPDPHGPERSERPVRQVQTGTSEVQKQGVWTLSWVQLLIAGLLRIDF